MITRMLLLGAVLMLGTALRAAGSDDPFSLKIALDETSELRLRFMGQHRTRSELRAPATYAAGTAEQRPQFQVNMRNRLGVDALFPGNAGLLFEIQDVRLWGDEPRAGANQFSSAGYSRIDVLQANLYTEDLLESGIRARLGRQKFTIGNQRLFSTLEWTPQSRAWDGLTLRRSFAEDNVRLMGLALLINELDRVQDDEWLLGMSLAWLPVKRHELELLVLHNLRDDPTGTQDARVWTASLRWNGGFGLSEDERTALEITAEGVVQTGRVDPAFWGAPGEDNSRLSTMAAAITADFIWGCDDGEFRLGAEWNLASGDSNADDQTQRTFRAPFPFAHKYHGWADQIGWRNLHEFALGAQWTMPVDGAVQSLTFAARGHAFQRENKNDGWYGASGALIRPGNDDQSRELGYELDLLISTRISRWVSAEIGWAHFFAGKFIKQSATGAGTGAEDSDMDFLWAQLSLQF